MKGLTFAAFVAAAAMIALLPVVTVLYGDAYPADPGKRQALAACARTDREFNRLFAAARAACYEHQLSLSPTPTGMPPPGSRINRRVTAV